VPRRSDAHFLELLFQDEIYVQHQHLINQHQNDLVMGNRLDFYPRHVKTLRRDDEHRIGGYFRLIKPLNLNVLH
jgi:hypothetical protein